MHGKLAYISPRVTKEPIILPTVRTVDEMLRELPFYPAKLTTQIHRCDEISNIHGSP